MRLIGLTGGVGMGKSTSARILQQRGLPVADTDDIARQLVEPGQPALALIRDAFGESILDEAGRLRRDALARIVFASEPRRRELEAITHPLIRDRWQQETEAWRLRGESVGVVVIPLLYETQAAPLFDAVVCVACSSREQSKRLAHRGWSAEECQRRLQAQWPIEKKMTLARFVVWTESDLEVLTAQWERILGRLLA